MLPVLNVPLAALQHTCDASVAQIHCCYVYLVFNLKPSSFLDPAWACQRREQLLLGLMEHGHCAGDVVAAPAR